MQNATYIHKYYPKMGVTKKIDVFEHIDGKIVESKRAVKYSDIAIIMRSVDDTYAKILKKKLKSAGIAMSIKNKTKLHDNIAVSVLKNYLELVDNIHNDIAFVSCLKSAFGSFFTDGELCTIRKNTAKLVPYNSTFVQSAKKYQSEFDDDISQRLQAFFNQIKEYKKFSYVMRIDELAGRICADFDYFKYVLALPGLVSGGSALSNFLDKLSVLPSGASLSGALITLKNVDLQLDSADEMGGVQLTTIHGSKGLEYPFVILCNTTKRFNKDDLRQDFLIDEEFGVAVKYFDFENGKKQSTSLLECNKLKEQKRLLEEEMRVLYVALTRAEYQLAIIVANDKKVKSNAVMMATCTYDYMYNSLGNIESREKMLQEECLPIELAKSKIVYADGCDVLSEKIKETTSWVYPYVPKTVKTSVTKIASQENETEKKVYAPFAVAKDTRATEIGNAYHKFLETLDYKEEFENNFYAYCKNFPSFGKLIKKELARKTYDTIKARISDSKFYRELPFVYRYQDGVMVQGVIDLLIMHKDGAEIIDYKAGEPSEKMLEVYKKQLNSYKEATENITKSPITKTSLFAISVAKFIEV